jgi:hypothetical protein
MRVRRRRKVYPECWGSTDAVGSSFQSLGTNDLEIVDQIVISWNRNPLISWLQIERLKNAV